MQRQLKGLPSTVQSPAVTCLWLRLCWNSILIWRLRCVHTHTHTHTHTHLSYYSQLPIHNYLLRNYIGWRWRYASSCVCIYVSDLHFIHTTQTRGRSLSDTWRLLWLFDHVVTKTKLQSYCSITGQNLTKSTSRGPLLSLLQLSKVTPVSSKSSWITHRQSFMTRQVNTILVWRVYKLSIKWMLFAPCRTLMVTPPCTVPYWPRRMSVSPFYWMPVQTLLCWIFNCALQSMKLEKLVSLRELVIISYLSRPAHPYTNIIQVPVIWFWLSKSGGNINHTSYVMFVCMQNAERSCISLWCIHSLYCLLCAVP